MEKKYCPAYDAYFDKSGWLEKQCCTTKEESDECYFNCWERPKAPCVDCKNESACTYYIANLNEKK